MELEKGDRVISTTKMDGSWSTKVPKGTKGVVIDVTTSMWSGTSYDVHFENGETMKGISDEFIAIAAKR